jgi:hypothetical protein
VLTASWRQAWDESFEYYRQETLSVLGYFGGSVIRSCLTDSEFGVTAQLLGQPASGACRILRGLLVGLDSTPPRTPGGLGVAETVAASVFRTFGMTSGER